MKNLIPFIVISLFASCSGGFSGVEGEEEKADSIGVKHQDTSINATLPDIDSMLQKDVMDTTVFDQKSVKELRSPGGVSIEILERTEQGSSIGKGDVVRIKYKGKLPDGTVFDSSDPIGMPLPYFVGVNMSVKGWDDALPLLQTGDKVRMKVPAKLGYGKKGYGKLIPPNTDLVFEMEIVDKMKGDKRPSGLIVYRTVERSGALIKDAQSVSIHFYGWIYSTGKLFDSSHQYGKTHDLVIGLERTLPCWDEALKTMRKGEKAILFSPAALAYAEKGIPEVVPANADLVFSIEVVDVK